MAYMSGVPLKKDMSNTTNLQYMAIVAMRSCYLDSIKDKEPLLVVT